MPDTERLALNAATTAGKTAITPRKNAPISVTLLSTFLIYMAVGIPGLYPSIVPPFFWRLFATSIGLNEIIR